MIAALVFIILFGISSLVHLFFCYIENEKLRHISKPFCVLFLAIAAICYLPNEPFIYVGAILGMLGDVFMLMKKKKIPFALGTILFFFGHVCYMVAAFRSFLPYVVPFWVYIIVYTAIIAIMFALYPFVKNISKTFALPGGAYFAYLGLQCVLGIVLICTHTERLLGAILFFLGYASFLASDIILTRTSFVKDIKRRDFYIMFFYLLAQAFIVSGLCLLLN